VASFSFGASQIIITGKKMLVQNGGNTIISIGNSKAVDGDNVLRANEMSYDKSSGKGFAKGDVIIETSSGTVRADNAAFDSNENTVVMTKDINRPEADIIYEGDKGHYSADKMTFFNYEKKKILMEGKVIGKMEIKEKQEAR
jgi:lipopolysaccharide assembly outer membrane protein LptD (OstA)